MGYVAVPHIENSDIGENGAPILSAFVPNIGFPVRDFTEGQRRFRLIIFVSSRHCESFRTYG